MTFHLMCVHLIFSSVSVAEWPPFGKQLLTRFLDHVFSLYFDYLYLLVISHFGFRAGFGF